MSACAQALALRNRAFSSEELTSVYYARIERYNAALHAFVALNRKRAVDDARKHDRVLRASRNRAELPPFFGVPTALKDMQMTRGFPTRMGTRGLPTTGYFDDVLSAQLRRAGFVFLGKLATSEVGAMPITEPDIHAPTATPWNLARSAGGSSGGSGCAVAAGLIPIAPGADGAGSIRIPASFNHLVGIKPSRGRIPNAYRMRDTRIIYSDGPLARSVHDAATLLDAMAGLTVGKPHWAPKPKRLFAEATKNPPPRLRIRLSLHHPLGPTDAQVEASVRAAAKVLSGLGHEVTEMPWLPTDLEEFLPIWQYLVGHTPLLDLKRVQPITRWLGEVGRTLAAKFVDARQFDLESTIAAWFGDCDAWITPTTSVTAPKLGLARKADKTPRELFGEAAVFGAFTAPFNLSGQPALSLPIGLSEDGLPMGIQIAGRAFGEDTIIALAAELERELPRMQHIPSAFAP